LNFNHKRQQLGTPQAITRATQDPLPLVWEPLQGWRKQPGHGMDPDIHRASGVLCAHLSHAVHAQLLPGSFACLVRVCVLCAFAICHSNTFFLGEVKLTTLSILSGVWCPLIARTVHIFNPHYFQRSAMSTFKWDTSMDSVTSCMYMLAGLVWIFAMAGLCKRTGSLQGSVRVWEFARNIYLARSGVDACDSPLRCIRM